MYIHEHVYAYAYVYVYVNAVGICTSMNVSIYIYICIKNVYAHASVCMHTGACASVYVQHGWMDGWMDGYCIYENKYMCGAICFKSVNAL